MTQPIICWFHAVLVSAGFVTSVASGQEPSQPEGLTDQEVLARTVHYWLIGGSSRNLSVERIGWGIPAHGWEEPTKRQAEYVRKSGCLGMWLHNPFGDRNIWPMKWDQRPFLLERIRSEKDPDTLAKLKRIEETFLPAMRKFLSGEWTDGRKPHLWIYLGTAYIPPQRSNVQSKLARAEDDPLAYTGRWWQSVYPVLVLASEFPGQVSIGMDRTLDTPADHPHYAGALMLANLGIEVIGEPRPLTTHPHWHRFGFVIRLREGGWDRTDPDKFAAVARAGATPDAMIKGKMYGLITGARDPKDLDDLKACRRVIEERGWTPVMWLGKLDLESVGDR